MDRFSLGGGGEGPEGVCCVSVLPLFSGVVGVCLAGDCGMLMGPGRPAGGAHGRSIVDCRR